MIRRLENELVAAEQQRKDTINEFNSLKASMNNSDVAAKEHIVYFTSKVIFRSPSRPSKGGKCFEPISSFVYSLIYQSKRVQDNRNLREDDI